MQELVILRKRSAIYPATNANNTDFTNIAGMVTEGIPNKMLLARRKNSRQHPHFESIL